MEIITKSLFTTLFFSLLAYFMAWGMITYTIEFFIIFGGIITYYIYKSNKLFGNKNITISINEKKDK